MQLEPLEDRTVPAVLTFLDTFSGATFSDGTVNSGGTASVDAALNPSLGVVVNNHVSNPRPNDSGTDTGLRFGPVDDGAADSGQLASTRTLALAATNPAVGGSTHADVDSGQLFFSSDAQNSATMTLTYANLSGVDLEVLTAGPVTVDFLSNDIQFNLSLKVNTGAGAGTDTFFPAQPVLASGAPQAITFDASALIGLKLNSMAFTFAGAIDTDFSVADIKANTGVPAIHIVKYVNGDDANSPTGPHVAVPGNVTFTYVVTNTGDVPLANVVVTDNKLGTISGPASGDTNTNNLLDLTETWTYTTIVPAVAGQQTNIGTVTGNAANPSGAQVTDDDPANYFGDTPAINIVKFANNLDSECGHVLVGSTVNFRYEVTNPGNVPIANVVVTDPDVANLSAPTKTGGNQDNLLDPGETWTYTASKTAIAGEHHNTGTVNGNDSFIAASTVTDNDDACYNGDNPQIQIIKFANNLDSECGHVAVGSTVNFRYEVTTPGNVPIANVVVTDPDVNNLSAPVKTGGNQDNLLDPGETWTYTASTIALAGEHHNTGTVNGNDFFIATATVTDNDDACYIGDQATVTRTLGFWQTHTAFTKSIFNNQLGGHIIIGSPGDAYYVDINTVGKLFGGFYASIKYRTNGVARSAVGQARMILLQQLLAAELNAAAFGASAATQTLIDNAEAAFANGTTTRATLLSYASQLDAYNSSGDTGAIPPALGSPGAATPGASLAAANKAFWNFVV